MKSKTKKLLKLTLLIITTLFLSVIAFLVRKDTKLLITLVLLVISCVLLIVLMTMEDEDSPKNVNNKFYGYLLGLFVFLLGLLFTMSIFWSQGILSIFFGILAIIFLIIGILAIIVESKYISYASSYSVIDEFNNIIEKETFVEIKSDKSTMNIDISVSEHFLKIEDSYVPKEFIVGLINQDYEDIYEDYEEPSLDEADLDVSLITIDGNMLFINNVNGKNFEMLNQIVREYSPRIMAPEVLDNLKILFPEYMLYRYFRKLHQKDYASLVYSSRSDVDIMKQFYTEMAPKILFQYYAAITLTGYEEVKDGYKLSDENGEMSINIKILIDGEDLVVKSFDNGDEALETEERELIRLTYPDWAFWDSIVFFDAIEEMAKKLPSKHFYDIEDN